MVSPAALVQDDALDISGWIKLQGSEWEDYSTSIRIRLQDDTGEVWHTVATSTANIFGWSQIEGSWNISWVGTLDRLDIIFSGPAPPTALNLLLDDASLVIR